MTDTNLISLTGERVTMTLTDKLALEVRDSDGALLWASSPDSVPTITVNPATANADEKTGQCDFALHLAMNQQARPFSTASYSGHQLTLNGFPGTDVTLALALAIDAGTDELLIQVEQTGGQDTVVEVRHLYRFDKPTAAGGYMVLPHGSGYLIHADCPDELPGRGPRGGLIGHRWALPMFGMVHGSHGMCAIVETWWDCDVEADHLPGSHSTLDFHWRSSLGKLAYPRRFFLRFGDGLDYVAMAKLYRQVAGEGGLLCTLQEKADQIPVIRSYIGNVLFRRHAWNIEEGPRVLADIRKLREMDIGINFFFPKWLSTGYSTDPSTDPPPDGRWQAWLLDDPVPGGGWPALVEYAHAVRKLGGVIQGFVNQRHQIPDAPDYDEERWPLNADGRPIDNLGVRDLVDWTQKVLDHAEVNGFKFDILYMDGLAGYGRGIPEDFSTAHPMTRRQNFEQQNACMAETRRRGIMAGSELGRFWAMAESDYFSSTDWCEDRLTNVPTVGAPAPVGEPIPLFQLVFHDCYVSSFMGGGYAVYEVGSDWWADRTPRLYELLFTAAPAYNWLPGGRVPVDWDSAATQRRCTWLKRWSAYYRAIAMSEMVSHQFLCPDRTQQRIEFADGVAAEFNMAANQFRVIGIEGFSGQWETPEAL